MKRLFFTPLLWGFFLSGGILSAASTPALKVLPHLAGKNRPIAVSASEIHARILAIRVQFQPDTLSTTTGNGTFGSGIPGDAVVDPLPHDRTYFEDHLTFLGNYFADSSVSKCKVTVDDFAVYPLEDTLAYVLPHQMWHYNYNSTPEDLEQRLVELFVDSWEAAAADPALDPTGWDTFIIYHAGVGQDFEVGFDETPHDVPSAYFTLEDLRQGMNDPGFPGVEVNGTYITGGLLLPESERQFEVDVEIAMNGTEALLFAHSIGLPALYNTENGQSGVGRFDLMDQGSGNFAGMIPSRPCAWSRAFMGWETPVPITPEALVDTFKVNLTGRGDPSDTSLHEIYRVNLNQSEYYLIENRSWDPDSLGYTYAYDRQNRRLKLFEDYNVEVVDDSFGVIVRVDNYDFGLPGEGILMWHVDNRVIEENYADNKVNSDLSHRGVALVEADAARDIGQQYGFLDIGYGTEYGWAGDFFFGGNSQFLAANPQINSVIFYDDSYPGARAYDGSPSGLRMGFFTPRDTVMSFWVRSNWAQEGFPAQLAEASGGLSPSALDFDEDDKTGWILTVTPGGAIQAFDSLGRAQGDVIETRWEVNLLGDSTQVTDTLLARVDTITATPALNVGAAGFTAFFPGLSGTFYALQYSLASGLVTVDSVQIDGVSGITPLIAGGASGRWYGGYLGGIIAFEDTFKVVGTATPFDSGEMVGMCLSDAQATAPVFLVSSAGQAALVDSNLNPLWTEPIDLPFIPAFPPITLVHQSNSRRDLVVVGDGGEVALLDPEKGDFRSGFPFNAGMNVTAPPVAADFDKDGWLELLLTGQNRILGVAANGTLVANWPLILDARRAYQPILSPPAIAELGFDGNLKVLFGWPGGSVDARDGWGKQLSGFSRSTSSEVISAPLLLQLDDDTETELVALDQSGALYSWNLEQLGNYYVQRRPWNGFQNGNLRQGIAFDPVELTSPDQSILVTTKVYPWPNPANDVSYIRYKMGQSGRITVRIFDGAGDLVKELSAQAEAGLEADLAWDLSDVSSGVYLGRVEAEAGGKKEKTIIKIAVVK